MKHSEEKLVGQLGKKVVFYETDKRYADLLVRLSRDGLNASYFFRAIMTGYIHQDQDMMKFVEKIQIHRNLGKEPLKNGRILCETGKEALENLKLSEEEIQSIFDILESENPDL